MSTFKEFANAMKIPYIPKETNFWFVRTESGSLYSDFISDEVISVGWDEVGSCEYIKIPPKKH